MCVPRRGDRALVDSSALKPSAAGSSWVRSINTEATASTEGDDDESVECPLCSLRLALKSSLEEHAKNYHPETDYVCPAKDCGKRFSTTGNLARHRRRHGYLPPIECPAPRCRYTTNAAHKLARHMKVHGERRTRVCRHRGCGKAFATTGNLNRHIRTQHLLPRGKRPGRPRRSSGARTEAAASSATIGGATGRGPDATVDAGAGAATRLLRGDREGKSDALLESLSRFLDAAEADGPAGLEFSQLLDELARFHAAQLTS